MLKDYDITILYPPRKAKVVADALIKKAESMGSLTYIPIGERLLALDVQALANQFVRLDVSEPGGVLACMVSSSSLYEHIRAQFIEGERVLLWVSPIKGLMRFGKKRKLSPRYIGLFEILERVGEVACKLALPSSLSIVHLISPIGKGFDLNGGANGYLGQTSLEVKVKEHYFSEGSMEGSSGGGGDLGD
ncbi:uncharacterized protein [Nicotiana tomentosiformis]|uniref:uncharacterized protein n=1 Tax=Nicotiana tomentosiformis TaxID=4098 RepID=UPI00388C5232